MITTPRLIEILLVEDNPGDVELIFEAFRSVKPDSTIHSARDGEEALDFLYKRGNYSDAIRPDLILLDLNMPRKNGKEVLAVIKEEEALKDIPVVVLTSSEAEADIVKSYKLHANAYIVKPMDMAQLTRVVELIDNFWLSAAKLPPRPKKTG